MLAPELFAQCLANLLSSLVLLHLHPTIGVGILFKESLGITVNKIYHLLRKLLLIILSTELLIVWLEIFNLFSIQPVPNVVIRHASSPKEDVSIGGLLTGFSEELIFIIF